MSKQAVDLIVNMCRQNQSTRYDVHSALGHPFITRDMESPLPLTQQSLIMRVEKERLLGRGVSLFVFLASVKLQKQKLNERFVPKDYLDKIYHAMNSTEDETPP